MMRYLDLVITDNMGVIDELGRELRLTAREKAKFKCLYQYQIMPPTPYVRPSRIGRPQILWASRVTRAKVPELLPAIARLMPDCDFHAYGARELGYRFPAVKSLLFPHHDLGNALIPAGNLHWRGGFKRFDSLPIERFDAMLYTSLYDGLPNVLIEAGSHGLPIVAPNIGGISELINDKTGWLVQNPLDAIEFADNLHACLKADATNKTEALADIVATRHSFVVFCRAVRDLVEPAAHVKPQRTQLRAVAM